MPAPLVILGAAAIARIAASAVARAAKAKDAAQAAAIIARATAKINKGSGSPAGKTNPGKAAITKAQKAFDKAGAEGPKNVKPVAPKPTTPKPTTPKPNAKPKPTPATPKATPKAPKDPAKTAAAQKKQPAKKTAAAASKKSAAPKDPAKKTQLQKKQTPLAKVPIKELTLGKPGKVSKKTLGMYGVAGVGALGYAVGGMNKSKGTDDKRITNESGRIISRTKLRTDKYGRRVTAEETKKRDNFRDSRKRMSADRNEEARETEMDRRKKFRKTKGKEAFGKAATRITKDKSKLAGKGIRTKRSEEEKRQRITYI